MREAITFAYKSFRNDLLKTLSYNLHWNSHKPHTIQTKAL